MKTITYNDIKSWNPCYDPIKYIAKDWKGTALDVLKLDSNVSAQDILWVVLRTEVLSDKILRLFAVDCAREALKLVLNPDPRSLKAVEVAEAYALGRATREEMSAAWSAAEAAARTAAWSAAESAAWSAAYAAEAATAEAAAAYAMSAAEAAARTAESASAFHCAASVSPPYFAFDRSVVYDKQKQKLTTMIEAEEVGAPLPTGATTSVSTGIKFDSDKIPLELLSGTAMGEIARVLGFGAKKYARDNWRGGMAWSRVLGAALRHLFAYIGGEDKDPESGLSHLAHAGCCIMFLLEYEKTHKNLDDRFKPSHDESVSK